MSVDKCPNLSCCKSLFELINIFAHAFSIKYYLHFLANVSNVNEDQSRIYGSVKLNSSTEQGGIESGKKYQGQQKRF